MKSTAFFAGSGLFIREEGLEKRRQIFDEIFDPELYAMQKRVAAKAIPLESVLLVALPRGLYNEADRPLLRALRRMADMRR